MPFPGSRAVWSPEKGVVYLLMLLKNRLKTYAGLTVCRFYNGLCAATDFSVFRHCSYRGAPAMKLHR